MKILNFIPLLIWSLGFLFIVREEKQPDNQAIASVYLLGCLFWFILGLIISLSE